ncbi:hypothetical protein GTX14_19100 [Streptomyces sp. SID4944]|nr:hypothetical protein [Streptomyces sp. SID4944]
MLFVLGRVWGTEGTQSLAGTTDLDVEQAVPQEGDVPALERGEAGDVLILPQRYGTH